MTKTGGTGSQCRGAAGGAGRMSSAIAIANAAADRPASPAHPGWAPEWVVESQIDSVSRRLACGG